MSRLAVRSLIALLFLGFSVCGAAAQAVGVSSVRVNDPIGPAFPLTVWYPAEPGGEAVTIGQTGVFEGVPAFRDAPPQSGRFPTIFLSHGGLRSVPDSGAWIARALAERGFLVFDIGSPAGISARERLDQIWKGPNRVRLILLMLQTQGTGFRWQQMMEWQNIGALGFYLGGTHAAMLGGARYDPARLTAACGTGQSVDCGWLAAQELRLDQIGDDVLGASYREDRIGPVLAVAPEYTFALSPESLDAMPVPGAAIALGGAAPFAIEPLADHGFRALRLDDATVPDGFPLCTGQGLSLLLAEGEDPALCGDPARRAEIHDRLIEEIVAFFRDNMPRD